MERVLNLGDYKIYNDLDGSVYYSSFPDLVMTKMNKDTYKEYGGCTRKNVTVRKKT